MAKMKTDELQALIGRMQENATGAFNGSIGTHRANLMRRYLGQPYGDEVEGRSKVVDTSVRDTIEAIKPELMDIFFGGDKVVEFTPKGEEDTAAAEQEMDVCNHIFQQENDGFTIAYTWFTDALLQKVGYVKRYWDEQKRTEIEEYDELTPEEAKAILADLEKTSDKVDVLERSGGKDEATGEISPLYIKIRRTNTDKKYCITPVPPEEMLVHPQWTRVDFKGCPFVSHKRPVTVSELIQMGFNRKQVEALPTFDKKLESEEATVRHSDQEFHEVDFNTTDDSMREVLVHESYILADFDGDGIAEQLQVFTGGAKGEILKRGNKFAIEEVTDAPFECLSPLPIPHRHHGLSWAEIVSDLAKVKTVMTRQLIDNVVASNNPDVVYDEDNATELTVKALSVNGIGRNIPIRGGQGSLGYLPIPQTAMQSLQAIEYIDTLKETRTGVTRLNQGLDADSLNSTARGMKQLLTAAQKKILLVARIFAETGFKTLFVNMHRDLRAGPVKKIATRLNNEYVEVNPRTWRHRTDVTVSVGLGTGDRNMQLQRLMMIYGEQKEAYASGMLPYKKLHHTMTKILELSGFKDVQNFWSTPEEVEQAMAKKAEGQQPDATQMLVQVEAAKVEATKMRDAAKLDADRAKLMFDKMKEDTKRLEIMMKDDRERDLAAAKIEADEAARTNAAVDGPALTDGR